MLRLFVILATIFFVNADFAKMLRGHDTVMTVTKDQAEKACSIVKDAQYIKMCVYDLLATQDLDVVNIYA
jgi:hypothetical protein